MNVLSLFDGMSCGQLALKRIGISPDKYFASEIKSDGIKVCMDNFPNTVQIGDVTNVDGNKFKGIDLLIGGSPCQSFSIAMRDRTGLEGKSKLFFEYVRILREAQPKYFLLENVGSMSKENVNFITDIMGVPPIQINSSLVSAQLRNRLYWTNIPSVTIPEDRGIELNSILTCGWSNRKKSRCLLESDSRPQTTPVKLFYRYYSTGFTNIVFENEDHFKSCKSHFDTNFKGKTAEDIDSFIGDLSVYQGIRILNQTELERLQTVDEGYTKILTRDKAAGVLGDGWTVDVIAHILKGIL